MTKPLVTIKRQALISGDIKRLPTLSGVVARYPGCFMQDPGYRVVFITMNMPLDFRIRISRGSPSLMPFRTASKSAVF